MTIRVCVVALTGKNLSFGQEAYLVPEGQGVIEGDDQEGGERHGAELGQQSLCAKKQQKKYRNSAIYRLAKREHSYQELYLKLKERFPDFDHGLIDDVLSRLVADGQLSDQRFTEAYIRMRGRKGFGPQRIARELRERGVCATLVAEGVDGGEYDWYELALETRLKKFGDGQSIEFKQRMKQQSFLSYRGFDNDQIKYALS